MSCFFIKLSIGLGYLRLLKLRHIDTRWERIVCYAVIILSCAINLEFFLNVVFGCARDGYMPLDAAFAIVTGRCDLVDSKLLHVSTYLQSSMNVATDLTLVLLPIPSIFGAIMDRRTRLSVIGILIVGAW
jgi:hypothetical protein